MRTTLFRALKKVICRSGCAVASFAAIATIARAASADASQVSQGAPRAHLVPNGPELLRLFESRAPQLLRARADQVGALVALPPGRDARALGLEPVAPGIARARGTPASLVEFTRAHPDLRLEVAPPLRPLLDRAGKWIQASRGRDTWGVDGKGVLVGVADTGCDVTHADMRDSSGRTRVAWLLDLSLEPVGVFPELEEKYGLHDKDGKLVAGAVLSSVEINKLLSQRSATPVDEVGHGTHVASIAMGGGGGTAFVGVAPGAELVYARVSVGSAESISNDDLIRAVEFMFDRADFMKRPISVNLSLGTDFGPHDGSLLWEKALASFVGPDKPGRALVVAAGNSGSIDSYPIHQSVYVASRATVRVPVSTGGAASSGDVQVWVAMRRGSELKVGLDGPDGEWIEPLGPGESRGKNTDKYRAAVIHGSEATRDQAEFQIPNETRGAVVAWTGAWPSGTYHITLEGEGMADLYLQALGEAGPGGFTPARFTYGVREGTINLPATHPGLLAVGCTVSRPRWQSAKGAEVGPAAPTLDLAGGLPVRGAFQRLGDGDICWFSSAGPTLTGLAKPEIAAPGAVIVGAMSAQAKPGSLTSIFTNPQCPTGRDGQPDPECYQVDATHAISVGTSMSSPFVAGAVALLLQRDPTLTQDKIVTLLQAGAHRFRGAASIEGHAGPGELDVHGSLDALEQMRVPSLHLPVRSQSWIALSSNYAAADGSTPVIALVELRTEDGEHRGDLFDPSRLRAYARLGDGETVNPELTRVGPGLWRFSYTPPPGHGGSYLEVGATFDGAPIVEPKIIPVSTDAWTSRYSPQVRGGCTVAGSTPWAHTGYVASLFVAFLSVARRRRRETN